MSDSTAETLVLRRGRLHDPANGVDGAVGDLWIRDGRIVEPQPKADREVDLDGLVVMPGGIDLHSHVAGPKVAVGRRMQRPAADGCPDAVPTIHATGRLYAALGYTTVFDAAIATAAASLAHLELAELPVLDKGIFLLAADDDEVVRSLAAGSDDEVARLIADRVQASRAWAVKVATQAATASGKQAAAATTATSRSPCPASPSPAARCSRGSLRQSLI